MRRRALLLGLGAAACGPKAPPALPPAPAVTSAAELIPADLDVVVRLDLARVRNALGAEALSMLARKVLPRPGDERLGDELMLKSLSAADVVYLAYRPSPAGLPLDRVLALQGRFEPLARAPNGFSAAIDLGADVRHWDTRAATERAGVARIYALGDRGLAFVSEAEIDAVERTLDGLGSPRRLEPPEEGTLSIAARPSLLTRLRVGGSLEELLEGARKLQLVVELDSNGVSLKAELALASPDKASALAAAAQLALDRMGGQIASGATLRPDGERVVLSAKLSRAELAPFVACLGDSQAGCPW